MRRNARCRAFTMNLSRTGSSDINRGLYLALFSVVHSPMKCGVNGHAFITPRFKCEILSDRLVSVLSTAPARGQALQDIVAGWKPVDQTVRSNRFRQI